MTPPFSVRTTPSFEGLARSLSQRHPEFQGLLERAVQTLEDDPISGAEPITSRNWRLSPSGRASGDSLGRFRFRYDVYSREVVLQYCGLRREDTYR